MGASFLQNGEPLWSDAPPISALGAVGKDCPCNQSSLLSQPSAANAVPLVACANRLTDTKSVFTAHVACDFYLPSIGLWYQRRPNVDLTEGAAGKYTAFWGAFAAGILLLLSASTNV